MVDLDALRRFDRKVQHSAGTLIEKAADEIYALRNEVKRKDAFIEAAFEAHSNLDLDVERVIAQKEGQADD